MNEYPGSPESRNWLYLRMLGSLLTSLIIPRLGAESDEALIELRLGCSSVPRWEICEK